MRKTLKEIKTFHAHVYYDEQSFPTARALVEDAGKYFLVSVGKMHQQRVGPHPSWSCQLEFKPDVFGKLIPWLSLNRKGLTIFIHPDTGEDLKDHADHALWMGAIKKLNLSFFNG